MSELYVDIATPMAINKLFTYLVPKDLYSVIHPGIRVTVPFGRRAITGLIVDIKHKSEIRHLKSILDILDIEPLISDDVIEIAKWIAEYYFVSSGEVIKAMLPPGVFVYPKRLVSINLLELKNLPSKPLHIKILDELRKRKNLNIKQLQEKTSVTNIYVALNELADKNIIKIIEQSTKLTTKPKFINVIPIDISMRKRWEKWLEDFRSLSPTKRLSRWALIVNELVKYNPEQTCVSVTEILKKSGTTLSTMRTLVRNGIISIEKHEVLRSPEFDFYEAALGKLDILLNPYQGNALEKIGEKINQKTFHTFLLHGITGSGKTQVYIEAIRGILNKGKTAIVLVPEISLTPQIVRRFRFHFGDQATVVHSRMSPGERYDAWRMAKEGKSSVVIGPRSAVFAPLKNLGLIIVDEEHETSYKQFDQSPRYHARDVAIMRASFANAVVILGSATPSLESYTNALNGKYTLLELPERVDSAALPKIEIVDMTKERSKKLEIHREQRRIDFKTDPIKAKLDKRKFVFGSISDILKEKISDRLKKKEGTILLQNRRGFSPFIECPDCGYVEMCDNCNISLTYHITKKHLRCHYCGSVKPPPNVCPQCGAIDIQYHGFGTQRVESELTQLFPEARLLRMDLDTTTTRGAHDKILRQFSEGEVDILLGTQMIAKGLDISRVTLVGVISADTQMLLPDFRSAERTFQLLTQVAGRAGRSNIAGEVVIQTYQPKHPSLQHVLVHDFKGFYGEEIAFRKELNYPPFSRLILIEFRGKRENEVMDHANKFAELLMKQNSHFITLGPAAAALTRLRNFYRWHIVIKSLKSKDAAGKVLHDDLQGTVQLFRKSSLGKSKSVRMIIDVDPVGMM